MENEEVRALMEHFEEVWRRVSPPAEAENDPQPEPKNRAAIRTARWFPEI